MLPNRCQDGEHNALKNFKNASNLMLPLHKQLSDELISTEQDGHLSNFPES